MAESEHMVRHAVSEASMDFANVPSNMDALLTGNLSGAERERIVAVIGEEIVARAAQSAEAAGARSVSTRVANGDYDEAILEMPKEVGADTIVIGHRGLGRLQRIFQGSVSQKINQQADCTVVTVR